MYPLLEISDTTLMLSDGKSLEALLRACPGNELIKTEHRIDRC
ncbi:MAG: hypothetical protein ACI9JM_002201 [Halioglobus sp.]